jgi:hypothetical protein
MSKIVHGFTFSLATKYFFTLGQDRDGTVCSLHLCSISTKVSDLESTIIGFLLNFETYAGSWRLDQQNKKD